MQVHNSFSPIVQAQRCIQRVAAEQHQHPLVLHWDAEQHVSEQTALPETRIHLLASVRLRGRASGLSVEVKEKLKQRLTRRTQVSLTALPSTVFSWQCPSDTQDQPGLEQILKKIKAQQIKASNWRCASCKAACWVYIGLWVHVIGVIQKEVSDSGQDLFTLCSHDVKNKQNKKKQQRFTPTLIWKKPA